MHKIFYGECPELLRSHFTQDNKRDKERKRFMIPRCTKEIRRTSIKYRGPFLWNSLPLNIRSIENFHTFKESLKGAKESIKTVSFLTLFTPGFFYPLNVQGSSLGTPLMISGTINASPMKLCTVIVPLKAYQNTKGIFKKLTYDVTMTSLLKQWENSDLRETRQIIHHSKGDDESFPKM